ncbi:endolytic transglycosylase MltG [Microbacterium sp. HD4P20]|uniref:endolytic transglycosylase MltG n=1 Tax=Microbacterium sp. HD4P20 TaxID=2864874 RepID=UPI0020A51937|nr:endolytic transglycosylase MltG [Microbacterium sp. HD4P20]MCP2636918.1 endolytic transglycosylase MltG [Microbacterium sp. HD4P20]
MPDSPSDDPFADLYGKLPDPRARASGAGGSSAGAEDAGGSGTTADGAPLSRRAAREAAARRTGSQPTVPAQIPPAARPTARGEHPAADDSGSGFQPVPLRAPRPTEQADAQDESAGDAWIFADAAAAPALPYSRTGATATVPAPDAARDAQAAGAGAARHPEQSRETSGTGSPTGHRADAASTREVRGGRRGGAPTATLDDLFSGNGSTDELGDVPPPKNRRRRRIGGWIALGVVLVILGGIAGGAWYVWTTYEDNIREVMGWEEPKDYEPGLANGEVFVTIASGDTGSPISQSLYDAGVTKTPEAFYDYLIETGQNPPFQPGVFRLQEQMTSEAALAALLDPANKMELTAQIPEGFTVDGTLERLAEGTAIPLEEFQAAAADPAAYGVPADSLEGWLFPATYTFDPSVTAQSAIQTLVDRTIQSLDQAGVPVEDRQEILTIASIIQREARFEADMQKVSRVIQNRLDPNNQETFGLLQMDSTAQYGYGELHEGSASTSEEAQYDPNPWNTYVHAGLPIGPIANPGDVAINAAMHPADGPWLYFVTVNLDTGETIFTETYNEHLRYVDQMQQWCSEHPDSGC